MRSLRTLAGLTILTLATLTLASAGDSPAPPAGGAKPDASLLGFAPARAAAERKLESDFASQLKAENLEALQARLAARPHHVGSPYDAANTEFIAAKFREWGYDVSVAEYRVLFPTPKTRLLEMTAPTRFKAKLAEPPLKQDASSGQTGEQLPTYNAYAIDGDVTGQLVYVNYGIPDDYDTLAEHGIDVKGKIVIARYGGSWRGIKPKVAAEHGALACIIYSDPRDDGYFQGDVYPKGAYRSADGVQRGSVADMPLYSGDPLTPDVAATEGTKRLPLKDAPALTKIPVLPISYGDAQPLLAALEGPVAPQAWRGALPITYHLGPGPATVHLKVESNWDLKPIRDVIARLPGSERPDELIMRGNHYDGWVNGADDPISGQVAMLEEARVVGALAKAGWRPKRTMVYCAWDGEEPGLLGSTEYVEDHAATLAAQAAVYINTDSNGRGFLRIGGSHTLEKFINQVARDVTDPQTGVSVWKRAQARLLTSGSPEVRKEARTRPDQRISALGSGSDYTPFLQHIGVAALNMEFGGEDGGGQYHSVYDSIDHFKRFGDPGFKYGVALAETCGRAMLRLANADVLPLEFKGLSDTIGTYQKELIDLADKMRAETEDKNRLIADGTLKLAADPTETFVVPAPKSAVPHFNFAPLQNATQQLQHAAEDYDQAYAKLAGGGNGGQGAMIQAEAARALDEALMQVEQALIRPEGLPKRPWYKHFIYAPGFYTGYGVKTLPAAREAIEQREWSEVDPMIVKTADTIRAAAEQIDKAAALIK